jgi:signal peptidase II
MLRGRKDMRKNMLISCIAIIIVVLDFLTKRAVIAKVMPYENINILPFLRIVHVENKGAAFGLFAALDNKFFIVISLITIAVIIIYALKFAKGLETYSFSLILGGALGNLIDRLTIGKVIDFIDVFIGKWHWPAFNVADSALTIGIGLFILINLTPNKAKGSS